MHEDAITTVIARRGGSGSSTVAILACIALVVGYFLPWTSLSPAVEGALGLTAGQVSDSASGQHDGIASRLAEGDAISGSDWASILDDVEDGHSLDESQRRRLVAARLGVLLLPYAAAALVLLLLLLGVPAGRVTRLGLGPLGALFAFAKTRFVATFLLVVVMALGGLVLLTAATLWAGVTFLGDAAGRTGHGIVLMAAGGGTALLSSFVGYGPGRVRAFLWAVFLVAAAFVAVTVWAASG